MSRRSTTALATLILSLSLALAGGASASHRSGHPEPGDRAPEHAQGDERRAQPEPKQEQPPASPGPDTPAPAGPRADESAPDASESQPPAVDPPRRRSADRPSKPERGRRASDDRATAQGDTRAPAAATTICHATGSARNPYVRLTVSGRALAAHRAHHAGRDLIPAPAAGCPAGAPGTPGTPDRTSDQIGSNDPEETTICHATGSADKPFIRMTVAGAALDGHRGHQDGRDIIPAPAGFCPAGGGGDPVTAIVTSDGGAPGQDTPGLRPLTDSPVPGGAGAVPGREQALPGKAAGATAPERREAGRDGARPGERLPFTGSAPGILMAIGLAAILAGLPLRRSPGGIPG